MPPRIPHAHPVDVQHSMLNGGSEFVPQASQCTRYQSESRAISLATSFSMGVQAEIETVPLTVPVGTLPSAENTVLVVFPLIFE
jgi:hypothetical protein